MEIPLRPFIHFDGFPYGLATTNVVENLPSCLTWTLTCTLCLLPVLDLGTAPVDAEGP